MKRKEYVKYFNNRQPPETRKISSDCLIVFEKECNFKNGEYYINDDLIERIREWIQTKNSIEWAKIANETQKRNRPIYNFYTHTKKIIIKSTDATPSLLYGETYIGKSGNKTYWAYNQAGRKKTYLSKEILLQEFSNINLSRNNKETLILHMMEKYGGSFIENVNSNDVINDFIEEQKILNKILNLIKDDRKFPYRKTTNRNINHFISNNENFVFPQAQFIQRVNRAREKRPLVAPSKETKNLYDYYDYPIHLIYDYLNETTTQGSFKWRKCSYCNDWFYARQKNMECCCPDHSAKMRKRRYEDK
jgi:hypothetical protein